MTIHIGLIFSCFLALTSVFAASDYEDSPVNGDKLPYCNNYKKSPCKFNLVEVGRGYCCPLHSERNGGHCVPITADCGVHPTNTGELPICNNYKKAPCKYNGVPENRGYCCPQHSERNGGHCVPITADCGVHPTNTDELPICNNYKKAPCKYNGVGVGRGYCCPQHSERNGGHCVPITADCGVHPPNSDELPICNNYKKSPCHFNGVGVGRGYCCPQTSERNGGHCVPIPADCGVHSTNSGEEEDVAPTNEVAPTKKDGRCFEHNIHYIGFGLNKPGGDNNYGSTGSAEGCQILCSNTEGCAWFNWERKEDQCWLKTGKGDQTKQIPSGVTGPGSCPGQIPIEFINVLNEEAMGIIFFNATEECPEGPDIIQSYGPLAAGSKSTVMISSFCHIIKITAIPYIRNIPECTAFTSISGIQEGPITISPNPKNLTDCEVTTTPYKEVQVRVQFTNVVNDEAIGTLTFKDTDLCPDNKQKYGPLENGATTNVMISSFCYIIEITASPTRPNSQECTGFTSEAGIQKGPIIISHNRENPIDCKVTND